jgi:hypothetical protein
MKAYHFHGGTLRDGRPLPPIGEWLEHDGSVEPCESGLHASEHPFDALKYAPGPFLDRVELEGDLVSHGEPVDKWVGRRRKRLATIDATELLRLFARLCALDVVHLWKAPDVVARYLQTGDETLRAAARAAAGADAGNAAWAAARAAAGAAARAAAGVAAGNAAWDAARAAARAAWDAARDAAWDDAWDAAWAAARAAWDAARDDAWDATGAAAKQKQRDRFQQMVEEAFEKARKP